MVRVAVCDDFQDAVTQITEYLAEYQQLKDQVLDITSFFNAEDLWEHLKSSACDLIILDIELVEMNGVELGHLIRTELDDHAVSIIYISAMDTYDRQLFDVQPLNFLPKPIDKNKLFEAVDLAIRLLDDRNHIFAFKDKNGSHRLKTKEILYFESFAHDLQITAVSGKYVFRASMSEIMNALSDFGFIQVHRSYIVNYDQIKSIRYDELTMANDEQIPISRSKRVEIRDILIKFGGKRL
ncbi:MAG: LytTR family DNA-binding domain-containing protein [Lachnospiraceae bacterium]|nr:LytTR family DNA-binding domain-containing protein [Ruminococcus sp.]MCM1276259.1 LytTR family DNA-binding domain-containing protein [Lachnospiraceae bacterium]